jgi:predicted MFS family arabinose efflux permease
MFGCVGLSIIAYAGFLGMPMIVGMLVDQLGFTAPEAGYIASAELSGIFVASIVTAAIVNKVNRRWIMVAGLAFCIVGNVGSYAIQDFVPMLVTRFATGVSAGSVYATSVAILAGSSETARNFTYLIFSIALSNAVILYSFPILGGHVGIAGVYMLLASLAAIGFFLVRFVPEFYEERAAQLSTEASEPRMHYPTSLSFVCLAAVFSFYFMAGGYWAYMERIGVDLGNTSEFVGKYIAIGTLFSLIGCGLAYWLSRRVGLSKPLLLSLFCVSTCLLLFGANISTIFFIVATAIIFLFWNAIDIYQLGTLANLDHTGRFCALTPASQGLGMAAGPAVAAYLLDRGFGYSIVPYLGALASFVAFLLYVYVYARLRKIDPVVADQG